MIPPQGNADFAAAMEKVLDVYRRPYDAAFPVVCMDETPRQLIRETREPVAAAAGRPAREDYEYRRRGSCNVFMATEPLAGRRMTKVTARRTKTDWAHFLNDIAERHPGAKRITLVMDNLRNPDEVECRFRRKWNIDSRKWNTKSGKWNVESGGSGTSVPGIVNARR